MVKKYSFLDAEVARRYDPQIGAIYYDQMVNKGKHHNQAVCACATHLLDRVRVILLEDRPYQLRDVDGSSITAAQGRAIIAQRYSVSQEVRRRNSRRYRKESAQRRAERKWQKGQRGRDPKRKRS